MHAIHGHAAASRARDVLADWATPSARDAPGYLATLMRVIDPDARLERVEGGHMPDGRECAETYWHGPCASWVEYYAAPDMEGWDWELDDASSALEDLILQSMPLLAVRVEDIDWLA